MLIDSHCHLDMLDLENFSGDIANVIALAKEQGVGHIVNVGVDLITAQQVIDTANRFENVYASVGLHPSEKVTKEPVLEDFLPFVKNDKVIAIGEMGLDYYYNKENLDVMRDRFRTQLMLADKLKKPVIIHSRAAHRDTIDIMKEQNARDIGGVMHCFTESYEMAAEAMDLGFYISFSGIVTFKNATNVAEVASKVPLESMLIETDAPYLTPAPFRGKPNGPQNVQYVAEKIAELKGVSVEEVASVTTNNFLKLMKLPV